MGWGAPGAGRGLQALLSGETGEGQAPIGANPTMGALAFPVGYRRGSSSVEPPCRFWCSSPSTSAWVVNAEYPRALPGQGTGVGIALGGGDRGGSPPPRRRRYRETRISPPGQGGTLSSWISPSADFHRVSPRTAPAPWGGVGLRVSLPGETGEGGLAPSPSASPPRAIATTVHAWG
jgi:hypothetical protein